MGSCDGDVVGSCAGSVSDVGCNNDGGNNGNDVKSIG